jgi:prolyl-tRNA synthetase
VVADHAVAILADFVCGANQEKHHLTGVNWERDMPQPETADIRNVVEGDPSPDGAGNLALCRGIEVGHVFYLGTKYSQALGATFLDEHGKPAVVEMGCYGIGVSRIVGAAIEQYHDDKGMVWPISLAPFEVVLCPIGYSKSEQVREHAQAVYQSLLDLGVDVILDDRDERPGAMFADWELIGVPLRLTLGERGLQKGMVEWQARDGVYEGELQSGEMERKGIVERVYAEVQKRRAHLLQEPLV